MLTTESWDYKQIWFSSICLFVSSKISTMSCVHHICIKKRNLLLAPTHELHRCRAESGGFPPTPAPFWGRQGWEGLLCLVKRGLWGEMPIAQAEAIRTELKLPNSSHAAQGRKTDRWGPMERWWIHSYHPARNSPGGHQRNASSIPTSEAAIRLPFLNIWQIRLL